MAFSVETYKSEEELSLVIEGTVTTLKSEQELEDYLESILPADIYLIIAKGGFFTVIENPLIVNVSLRIVAKGGFFTVILETA